MTPWERTPRLGRYAHRRQIVSDEDHPARSDCIWRNCSTSARTETSSAEVISSRTMPPDPRKLAATRLPLDNCCGRRSSPSTTRLSAGSRSPCGRVRIRKGRRNGVAAAQILAHRHPRIKNHKGFGTHTAESYDAPLLRLSLIPDNSTSPVQSVCSPTASGPMSSCQNRIVQRRLYTGRLHVEADVAKPRGP